MKRFSKFTKINIYVFGVLSNILPIIGLFIIEGVDFEGLHKYQFWAWIFGAIYYIFVWVVGIIAWKRLRQENISLEERIKILEDRLGDLPVQEEQELEKELKQVKRKK